MENEKQELTGTENGGHYLDKLKEKVLTWHRKKYGYDVMAWAVYRKLLEEIGELGEAIASGDLNDINLEFGDVGICLLVLENKLDTHFETDIELAYSKIDGRLIKETTNYIAFDKRYVDFLSRKESEQLTEIMESIKQLQISHGEIQR